MPRPLECGARLPWDCEGDCQGRQLIGTRVLLYPASTRGSSYLQRHCKTFHCSSPKTEQHRRKEHSRTSVISRRQNGHTLRCTIEISAPASTDQMKNRRLRVLPLGSSTAPFRRPRFPLYGHLALLFCSVRQSSDNLEPTTNNSLGPTHHSHSDIMLATAWIDRDTVNTV